MSTSNFELMELAKYFNLDLVDVVQKDNLHKCPKHNNCFYIINTASSYENNGTHWVCLYLNNKQSFYFDSYASTPLQEVINFCKSFSKHLSYNNYIIQSLGSDNCGIFCLAFILFMTHNDYEPIPFIKAFRDREDDNDRVLEGIIRLYTPHNNKIPKVLKRFFNQK